MIGHQDSAFNIAPLGVCCARGEISIARSTSLSHPVFDPGVDDERLSEIAFLRRRHMAAFYSHDHLQIAHQPSWSRTSSTCCGRLREVATKEPLVALP
jgi:hypothetical protein